MKHSISIIITSYKEPAQVKIAIEHVLLAIKPASDFISDIEIIVVTPDEDTFSSATESLRTSNIQNYIIKDDLKGKPAALNLAFKKAKGDIYILTDGDMYIGENSLIELLPYFDQISVGGVSGHPLSLDDKNSMFGFFSHLHCHFADLNRKKNKFVPMSGYLYAFRNIDSIKVLPEEIRSEDAYISYRIIEAGLKIKYAEKALAYVYFPKNTKDWLNQKTRSLGGNVQLKNYINKMKLPSNIKPRNIIEDLRELFNVLFYAKNIKELTWIVYLYYLRFILWLKIITAHLTQNYRSGAWDRIESSKC